MIELIWNLFRDIATVILLAWCVLLLVMFGSVGLNLLLKLVLGSSPLNRKKHRRPKQT